MVHSHEISYPGKWQQNWTPGILTKVPLQLPYLIYIYICSLCYFCGIGPVRLVLVFQEHHGPWTYHRLTFLGPYLAGAIHYKLGTPHKTCQFLNALTQMSTHHNLPLAQIFAPTIFFLLLTHQFKVLTVHLLLNISHLVRCHCNGATEAHLSVVLMYHLISVRYA